MKPSDTYTADALADMKSLADAFGAASAGGVVAPILTGKRQYHLDMGTIPVLGMEEVYKRYLEDVLDYVDTSSPRGKDAQAKLDQLRDTHPEFFL